MDTRRESHSELHEPVLITILNPAAQPIGGVLKNFSTDGMQLRTSQTIELGTPVKVETKDMLMWGEAVRCEPDRGAFEVALQVHPSQMDLHSLRQLNRALLEEQDESSRHSSIMGE
jgi:hypothetical protein